MSFYYQNVRGLKTKTGQFYVNLLNSEHSLICCTETWLREDVNSSELFNDRYVVFRNDRNVKTSGKTDGGGVLIALDKSRFKSVASTPRWNIPTVEMVSVSTSISNSKKLNIFCIYLEPGYSIIKLELLLSGLESALLEHPSDDFLFFGDWNVPSFADFDPKSSLANVESRKCRLIFDFMSVCNLRQLNSIRNHNNRVLDLVFSTLDLNFLECDGPLVRPDPHHPPLVCDFRLEIPPVQGNTFVNYKKSDYFSINSIFCQIDWISLFNNNETVSGCVDTFYNVSRLVIKEFSPIVRIKKSHFPKWYSKNTIFLLKQKWRYQRKWKRFRNPHDYSKFSDFRKDSHNSISSDYATYIFNSENSIISSPRYFWSFFDNSKNDSHSVPHNISWKDPAANDEASDIFKSDYSSNNFIIPETQDLY